MSRMRKRILSESTEGQPISAAVADALIHTAKSDDQSTIDKDGDEVYLYANNESIADAELVISIEDSASLSMQEITIPVGTKAGLILALPGLLLQDGAKVYIRSAIGADMKVSGFVQEYNY